ncbi:MAG TPA: hypothetical protein VLM85_15645 [Polyangiaceae bacterium]|nr:hypothetical protein [Polyangiaceae bacterium]
MRGAWVISTAAASLLLGCAQPATITYAHCPVPVMLSPVDRVGATAPVAGRETGKADVLHASTGFSESTQSNGQFSTTFTEITGPMALTVEVLKLVPNRNDVEASDILLDGVFTGTFIGGGLVKVWGDPRGRKVWIR